MLFAKATNTQAYLKAGFMGFAGDGKTFTATRLAIGLVELMRERELEQGNKPAFFLDTETGSDWVKPQFDGASIELMTAKTRAFVDLIAAIREAEEHGSILLIDSISHFWRDLTESYAEKKNRKRGLEFQDWAWLKKEWGRFTDLFVNSKCHIVMCGRAGYEYDFFESDSGKKELQKTGVKMKAETETGYEPSILVLMQKMRNMETGEVWREGSILKDRANLIDGKTFKNPTFENFRPHIDFLNLGGKHVGIDTSRNSQELVEGNGKPDWQYDKEQKEIALDEIVELLNKHYGGQSADAKKAKGDLVEKAFGTRSWKRVETFPRERVEQARAALWQQLEGVPYGFTKPAEDEPDDDMSAELALSIIGQAETAEALTTAWESVTTAFREANTEVPLDVETVYKDRLAELSKAA